MSRETTPASAAPSPSPSVESRFVPRPSAAEPPSVAERHFAEAPDRAGNAGGEGVRGRGGGVDENVAVSIATPETKEGRAAAADGEGGGIVGATICFTPDHSPRSSPGERGTRGVPSSMSGSAMHVASSLDGRSTTEYEILDGISSKGTIEVQDLSSGGEEDEATRETEEEAKGEGNPDRVDDKAELTLSPCGTLPSLGETPFRTFDAAGTPRLADEDRRPLAPTDPEAQSLGGGGNEDEIPAPPNATVDALIEMFETPQLAEKETSQAADEVEFRIALKLDLESSDTPMNKGSEDGNSPNTSPKADERQLTLFKNLHKYWEGDATKSPIGRILCEETPKDVDLDAKEEAKSNIPEEFVDNESVKGATDFETAMHAKSTSGEKSSSSEKSTQTSGTHVNEPAVPKSKVKDALSGSSGFVVSFVVSASLLVTFLYGQIYSILCMAQTLFWQVLLGKVAEGVIARETIRDVDAAAVGAEDSAQHSGTNLSKLFSKEALKDETKSRLGEGAGRKREVDRNVAALDQTEKALLRRINDRAAASIIAKYKKVLSRTVLFGLVVVDAITAKCKKALSGPKAIRVSYAVALYALVSTISAWYCVVQRDTGAIRVGGTGVREEPANVRGPEDDLLCFSNRSTSFASIPPWEFGLSPASFESPEAESPDVRGVGEDDLPRSSTRSTDFASIPPWEFDLPPASFERSKAQLSDVRIAEGDDLRCFSTRSTNFDSIAPWEFELSLASFESIEEELPSGETPATAGSSPWPFAFVVLSAAISLFCATSKIRPPLVKPESPPRALAGIWTEEEHKQFLEGYDEHWSRWKLVSEFVPTRTHAQVRGHGTYWLRIRSPKTMKKSRKAATAPSTPPRKKNPDTPSSVLSTGSTPRKSNQTKVAPIDGILIQVDHNQLYANETPRSARRTRRTAERKAQGSKSDPGKKRVRFQAP